MREIRFRGKSKETGKWVYGDLRTICTTDGEITINYPYKHEVSGLHVVMSIPVDPDTVGQFTGLRDAKGTEIYEGDLVDTMALGMFEVIFDCGAFRIAHGCIKFTMIEGSYYEVVGNVHNAPELMKK